MSLKFHTLVMVAAGLIAFQWHLPYGFVLLLAFASTAVFGREVDRIWWHLGNGFLTGAGLWIALTLVNSWRHQASHSTLMHEMTSLLPTGMVTIASALAGGLPTALALAAGSEMQKLLKTRRRSSEPLLRYRRS